MSNEYPTYLDLMMVYVTDMRLIMQIDEDSLTVCIAINALIGAVPLRVHLCTDHWI